MPSCTEGSKSHQCGERGSAGPVKPCLLETDPPEKHRTHRQVSRAAVGFFSPTGLQKTSIPLEMHLYLVGIHLPCPLECPRCCRVVHHLEVGTPHLTQHPASAVLVGLEPTEGLNGFLQQPEGLL